MLHFIYELTDPKTDLPGYVGITNNPNIRYKQHLAATDNNLRKKLWIQRFAREGIEPKMNILEVVEGEQQARIREKLWIQHYVSQGIILTNIQENQNTFIADIGGETICTYQEARYAAFMLWFGIPYEYKTNGCKMNETWYVPSFWLPKQDCFLEVKEQEPSEKEYFEARNFALHTNKSVYLVYDDDNGLPILMYEPPPTLFIRSNGSFRKVELSSKAFMLLQRLDSINIHVTCQLHQLHLITHETLDNYPSLLQKQVQALPTLINDIKQVEAELKSALEEVKYGVPTDYQFVEGPLLCQWVECIKCHDIAIKPHSNERCHDCIEDNPTSLRERFTYREDTPALLMAHAEVRQIKDGDTWNKTNK